MIKDAIVERIKQLCAERHISFTELARLAGMTPSTIYSLLESERRDVSAITVKKICDGLDISLKEFYNDKIFDDLPQEIE